MNYLKRLKQSGEFEYSLGANAEEIKHIEEELGILLPEAYVNFLSECGSCNYGDVYINGIYKEKDTISYPVVELTKQLREELHLSEDFIVLHYEVDEFLTLYKVSNGVRLKMRRSSKQRFIAMIRGPLKSTNLRPCLIPLRNISKTF